MTSTSTGSTFSISPMIATDASIALSNRTQFSFKMSDTQRQLIASILKCLNRILEHKECGKKVVKLLGSIGFILLPLLDMEGQTIIQELSMDCIKKIIRIDCDVLRRPLMEISGTKIPSCPLKIGKDLRKNGERGAIQVTADDSSLTVPTRSNTIVDRCRELLLFTKSVPEQVIF